MFPETEAREILRFSGNKINCFPRRSRGDYATKFTEPEENNCFSIITHLINRATAFSFILFFLLQKHQEIIRRLF